ncbi:TetR/AcrR family transcriptional regulator [Mucilaginibacter agri]|uniref:TetR family transcriptional regulator n=1 Tax=Mucilaginibacter agri TaxID=2695265 RepID=A0A965ZM90_9SPHI|nr:TetR/AcrR family transcriptional regulator [Mucilaginibacter agri]NCD72186.1 TetR family transcriptional regulator [Mucilaginibacter agri]
MSQEQRILEGALELFMQAGIKSVTMDDIARHLGMSKKTIYQHFSDKNELVVALTKTRMEEDERMMKEMLEGQDNVIKQLIDMMKCSEEILAKMNPIVIHDMQKYHPEGWKLIQQFKAKTLVVTLEELLTRGIKEGFIRPELDVKIIARMRMLQVETGFDNMVFPITEFNQWKVQQQFLEHFNYGIVTLEGYKMLCEYQNINQN